MMSMADPSRFVQHPASPCFCIVHNLAPQSIKASCSSKWLAEVSATGTDTLAFTAEVLMAVLPCSELHDYFPLVPEPIREYIDEVKLHLQLISEYEGPQLGVKEKLAFLQETRHAFGRTALVLSGGGALGAFHLVRLTAAQPTGGSQSCCM